ncbi:DUF4232 domain-containing protein [Streptomyces tropicalis]|uniref:DUF4232 domain-containing protein n=1 Tax=Streptomyces tropicalis TaxID=3034234 RepID=A0ABT6A2U6_9ACTN|nr:DUF4232 domain-containing protein [Streptomyces tropicalis]MDF3298960.1 DUF4232 domain-containing protein [Streptomyces tropicalis]
MAHRSPILHRSALLAGAVATAGLLTACGSGGGTTAAPQTPAGSTAAGTGGAPTGPAPATATAPGAGAGVPGRTATASAATGGGRRGSGPAGTRCHTSELRASVGRNNPGAGQENFPVVLTNTSHRTCTVRGYPGAAFVDASGTRLGPDPRRSPGTPVTVTLKPGASAWAGLTFSNPEVSGARTAAPAALIVTPPDERDHLTVRWTAGRVPVGGNASSVSLSVVGPGTGG